MQKSGNRKRYAMDLSSCCKASVQLLDIDMEGVRYFKCSKCGQECGMLNTENLMEDK